MGGQKVTRRQKDISRLLREKKKFQPLKHKKIKNLEATKGKIDSLTQETVKMDEAIKAMKFDDGKKPEPKTNEKK